MVLWHTEVEQQKPADIAPLLGMSANSVSALAYRAREGLRQAFLSQHAADPDDVDCAWTRDHLGAYVRGGLSRRDAARVDDHLADCRACAAVYLELTEVNSGLAALLAPLLLGAAGRRLPVVDRRRRRSSVVSERLRRRQDLGRLARLADRRRRHGRHRDRRARRLRRHAPGRHTARADLGSPPALGPAPVATSCRPAARHGGPAPRSRRSGQPAVDAATTAGARRPAAPATTMTAGLDHSAGPATTPTARRPMDPTTTVRPTRPRARPTPPPDPPTRPPGPPTRPTGRSPSTRRRRPTRRSASTYDGERAEAASGGRSRSRSTRRPPTTRVLDRRHHGHLRPRRHLRDRRRHRTAGSAPGRRPARATPEHRGPARPRRRSPSTRRRRPTRPSTAPTTSLADQQLRPAGDVRSTHDDQRRVRRLRLRRHRSTTSAPASSPRPRRVTPTSRPRPRRQSRRVAKGRPVDHLQPAAPSTRAQVGDTYDYTASGGASGNAVTVTTSDSDVCTVVRARRSRSSTPAPASINADQAGNADYEAAPTVTAERERRGPDARRTSP